MIAYLLEEDREMMEYSIPRSVGIAVTNFETALDWANKDCPYERKLSKIVVTDALTADDIEWLLEKRRNDDNKISVPVKTTILKSPIMPSNPLYDSSSCKHCSNNPLNGGNGLCKCILDSTKIN